MTDLLKDNGIILWEKEKIEDFRQTLLKWYDENKRDLPWRRTKNPYAIWVSEIMLQQTQVVTVIPYYTRFMTLFPTITDLANAPESVLLKAWEGLGYYSRVRNMQKAAQQMVALHNGKMPQTLKDILALKGIGPYTAGAIASIAFNLPEPAVDGNVMRVMARLFEINLDIAQPKTRTVIEALMKELIDPNRPGDFNQALMDLGTDICSAFNPKPEISPIKKFNAAYQNGTMHIYPIKSKKAKATNVYYTAYVIENDKGQFYLQQREENGLLANMWLFPMVENKVYEQTALNIFENEEPYTIPVKQPTKKGTHEVFEKIGTVTHLFSHLKWHIDVVKVVGLPANIKGIWVHPSEFHQYPMPTPQQKMLTLIKKHR
ncbi:A/G-specific adenine glycosylase [Carnobacteriaceae bacterium zg-ZUI78]|nr:A/G-specific adenine glycosylase [Carnobacteriaceae bacterium zg-ZUI78]